MMRMTKILTAVFAAAAGLLLAESEYEKKHFETVTYRLRTDKLDAQWDGVRLVFLSDLHDNCFGADNEKLKSAIKEIAPDIVLIGGDMMVTKPWKKLDFSGLAGLLSWLSSRYPVYYANGNHESRMKNESETYPGWYEAFVKMLRDTGVCYLSDNRAELIRGESRLYIYGLNVDEDYYKKGKKRPFKDGYMKNRLGEAVQDGYHLLMAHTPVYLEEYARWGADLVLSGHFHGGTIRLPGIGGVMSPQFNFFSKYNNDMAVCDGVPMVISAGLGTHSVNVRLNNPPQIVVLEVKTEESGLQES